MSPKSEPCRILAVGAHPDDIEFACGGILLVEAARGSELFLCVCSRGESGTNGTPDEREAEARQAAELFPAQLDFCDLGGDAHIAVSVKNSLEIARRIRVVRPDILLGPVTSPNQHPDHAVVGHLCRDAARLARYGGIEELRDLAPHVVKHCFGYAVTTAAEPARDHARIRLDISAQFERWIEVMKCHRTQLRTRDYIELQTARARLLGVEAGVPYAQALFATDHFLAKSLSDLPPSIRRL